jgi:hypothetical protein
MNQNSEQNNGMNGCAKDSAAIEVLRQTKTQRVGDSSSQSGVPHDGLHLPCNALLSFAF